MPAPSKHPEERRRLAALHALNVLDTEREERFDRITRLAQRVFNTQAAQVNLLDRERVWFKSSVGFCGDEAAREWSFCAHTILGPETTVVGDARLDERFADNPHVLGDPSIRFYAGHPIAAPTGEPVGTFCIFDDEPRDAAGFDSEALRELAAMAEAEIASLTLAIGDELTGLSNRRGFELLGERLINAARRLGVPVTVLYADLDNLKAINDELGHDAGDHAIEEAARLLTTTLRDSDLIARLGGDEFAAILAGAAASDAAAAKTRIEKALDARNQSSDDRFELSLSLGLADAAPPLQISLWELTALADQAMLSAKRLRHGPQSRHGHQATRPGPAADRRC
jgi:diguanylate cyclase (GGDEF)-like protein